MATEKQREFFDQLLAERQFPEGTDKDAIRQQFAGVSDKSASAWIEKALTLPEQGETAPPF